MSMFPRKIKKNYVRRWDQKSIIWNSKLQQDCVQVTTTTSAYIAHKEINVSFVVQNDQLKETTFIRLLKWTPQSKS